MKERTHANAVNRFVQRRSIIELVHLNVLARVRRNPQVSGRP